MKRVPCRVSLAICAPFFAFVACVLARSRALAQTISVGRDPGAPPAITLWEDPKTHQVFTVPGRGRRPLRIPLAALANEVEQRATEKAREAARAETTKATQSIKAELAKEHEEMRSAHASMASQIQAMEPAWRSLVRSFQSRVRIGALAYADYGYYTHTGFGPQFMTQLNWPGPGNNNFNAFNWTRGYINIFWSPSKHWTLRLTPNVYTNFRTAPGVRAGLGSAWNPINSSLAFRLKYGYLDYNNLFANSKHFKGAHLVIGQAPEPLVPWEEDLYAYRFVNLVPWNYVSLSSTFMGISVKGPVKFGGLTYIDYHVGVYNEQSFTSVVEQADTKQVMARVSYYPLGALWQFQGLGITGFVDYGWGNAAPSLNSLPNAFKAGQSRVTRTAALLHYTTENWQLAGEFDWGHNAFTAGNLFTGVGPQSEMGLRPGPYYPTAALANALLNNGGADELGFAFFGHYHIPYTPLSVFGMFQQFMPNTKVNVNPFDWQRYVIGIAYQYNEYLRFAIDTQNLTFYHSQFNFPTSYARTFAALPGITGPYIMDAVPRDTHAFFMHVEFAY